MISFRNSYLTIEKISPIQFTFKQLGLLEFGKEVNPGEKKIERGNVPERSIPRIFSRAANLIRGIIWEDVALPYPSRQPNPNPTH